MVSRYPLSWPDGWARLAPSSRKSARFAKREQKQGEGWARLKELSIYDAIRRILEQLEHMQIREDDVLISTNIPTRIDGFPRSDQKAPADPGAAVYWRKSQNVPMSCIAIDIYDTVAGNLGAIAATLEAMRAIERHGGAQVRERTFRGFAALPASTTRPWREVLNIRPEVTITEAMIETAFRKEAIKRHPDQGGSHDAMAELNSAREQALMEVWTK